MKGGRKFEGKHWNCLSSLRFFFFLSLFPGNSFFLYDLTKSHSEVTLTKKKRAEKTYTSLGRRDRNNIDCCYDEIDLSSNLSDASQMLTSWKFSDTWCKKAIGSRFNSNCSKKWSKLQSLEEDSQPFTQNVCPKKSTISWRVTFLADGKRVWAMDWGLEWGEKCRLCYHQDLFRTFLSILGSERSPSFYVLNYFLTSRILDSYSSNTLTHNFPHIHHQWKEEEFVGRKTEIKSSRAMDI